MCAHKASGHVIAEDELQEEDHLGKKSVVPKAILHR